MTATTLALVMAGWAPTPAAAWTSYTYLPVPKIVQTQGMPWCSPASNQSVMKYVFGVTYKQCQQVNDTYGLTVCCNDPPGTGCKKGIGFPDLKAINWNKYRVKTSVLDWTLTWTQLTTEITTNGRPFLVVKVWKNTDGSHAVVMRGHYYHDGSGYRSVSVMDPGDGSYQEFEYSFFKDNLGFYWRGNLWKYSY